MQNPTKHDVRFHTWWELFDAAMQAAGQAPPGMQDAKAHYEMGQTPEFAVAEALAGRL